MLCPRVCVRVGVAEVGLYVLVFATRVSMCACVSSLVGVEE